MLGSLRDEIENGSLGNFESSLFLNSSIYNVNDWGSPATFTRRVTFKKTCFGNIEISPQSYLIGNRITCTIFLNGRKFKTYNYITANSGVVTNIIPLEIGDFFFKTNDVLTFSVSNSDDFRKGHRIYVNLQGVSSKNDFIIE